MKKKYTYELTNREKEILELFIKGFDIKEIIEKLEIKNCTIKTTLSKIYQKLEVAYSPVSTVRTKAIIKYLVEIGELDEKWIKEF